MMRTSNRLIKSMKKMEVSVVQGRPFMSHSSWRHRTLFYQSTERREDQIHKEDPSNLRKRIYQKGDPGENLLIFTKG